MISSLTLQLTEKDKTSLSQLASKDTDEKDTQQEAPNDKLPGDLLL